MHRVRGHGTPAHGRRTSVASLLKCCICCRSSAIRQMSDAAQRAAQLLAECMDNVNQPTSDPREDFAGPGDERAQPTMVDDVAMNSNPSGDVDREPNPDDEADWDRDASPSVEYAGPAPRSRSPRRQGLPIRARNADLSLKFCMRCGARTLIPPLLEHFYCETGSPVTLWVDCRACHMALRWTPGGDITASEADVLHPVTAKVDAGYAGTSRV